MIGSLAVVTVFMFSPCLALQPYTPVVLGGESVSRPPPSPIRPLTYDDVTPVDKLPAITPKRPLPTQAVSVKWAAPPSGAK